MVVLLCRLEAFSVLKFLIRCPPDITLYELVLARAKLVINLIYIPSILGVYIKALHDVVNVNKLALDLARDYGSNIL
jgi:hypothetical protein